MHMQEHFSEGLVILQIMEAHGLIAMVSTDASVFAFGAVSDGMVLAGTDLSPNWIYVSYDNGFFSPYSEGLFENASVEAFAVNETFMFAGTDYNGVWRRCVPGVYR